ncbi:ATP-binding protein [Variovorax boronicumulans]|uniref:ATP-binding protein n=1 Tax=Variovorax boronicumulans TaxID=436515 RepID=UPI002782A490|nr:ATP-binding protein [Variovorax boronicumulans]MDQ0045031.1 hypothetical protein [Variovorax boronicumulans]
MTSKWTDFETREIIPDPVALMESMRAVGYTPEAAIADLIDNSISAQARSIDVEYDAQKQPFVAILDDGTGMNSDELESAMRHGSRNPSELRDQNDLGRFGLGLKTASLSQCRRLTVISKREGLVTALRWDLDVVASAKRWLVVVPDMEDLEQLPLYSRMANLQSGTLVIWQQLDRFAAGSSDIVKEMTIKFSGLREHLALIFHRFTSREDGNAALNIRINGLALPRKDPFLRTNSYRQPLEGQRFKHQRGVVVVTPFVLPPISKLSKEEIELSGGAEGLRGTQGFYVYRNRRLVIWGTWFRLVPKQEFYKLTRIQVDIPNTFDELWSLDIKKSAAQPPEFIRTRLRELIPHFAGASKRTVTYEGRRTDPPGFSPVWSRYEPKHGSFRYEVNVDHPAVLAFSESLDEVRGRQFESLLSVISIGLPAESIYADMCGDTRPAKNENELSELIAIAIGLEKLTGLSPEEIADIDPLIRHPNHRANILKALKK